jgi:hypothetical protein
MNSSKNIKNQVTLVSLNVEELVTLKDEITKKYEISLEEKEKRKTKNDNDYILEYFVRYLNLITHFFISKSNIACLNIEKSFTRSTKSTINVNMIKIFCDLTKNFVINKRWRKTRKFRITIEQSIYLLLFDKKLKSNEDYTMINSARIDTDVTLSFHFVTTLDSRISQNQILFTRKMSTIKKRTKVTQAITIAHYHWKIQTHKLYKNECKKYISRRIQWKIHLMKETFKISNILWFITTSDSNRLNETKILKISENCRFMIEVEEDELNEISKLEIDISDILLRNSLRFFSFSQILKSRISHVIKSAQTSTYRYIH